MMRLMLVALAMVALMGGTRPGAAREWYPWCAQYADRSGITECGYTSFEQCLATVRGIGGSCVQNWRPVPREVHRDRRWKDFYR